MDLGFSQEQEMLRKMARDFLTEKCPKALVRAMEEDERGYPPELWREMAGLGWMGLAIPEKYGGQGMTFLDLCVLLDEMGRALVPGPFFSTAILGALPVLEAGTEEQKKSILPQVASGQLIMTQALTEPSATYLASGVALRATARGDGYVLNGTKLFVPNAHVADCMMVVARTREGANPEDGITLFLVDPKAPGISQTLLKTIGNDRQSEVVFDNVRVSLESILGQGNQGWPIIKKSLEQAAAADCLWMVGGAQFVLEMTTNYAKERVQFGRPIGSFQAIQHKLANMVTEIDGARYIAYQAAWMLSEGLPCTKEVSMAKAWTSEAYRRACAEGHQIHGGIGYTKDHDMQLYYRRAKTAELLFGDADFHREIVAQQMGL